MSEELLLCGGRVLDPTSDMDEVADVRVADGVIVEVGATDRAAFTGQVIDCAGLWVTPGFVDLHTHLREPGFEGSEDLRTGTAAAAAGGYTAVCAMANTDPVCDTAAVAELVWQRARSIGLADVFPVGAITKGLAGVELAEMGELYDSIAGVDFFSDDGKPVADSLIMRRALAYARQFDAVICNHSEDPALTAGAQMHEGEVSSLLGLAGWPHEAEEVMIARDLILAQGTGTRLHIPHLSTAGAVELVRAAKDRGIRVTAEVTPHHLLLEDTEVRSFDPVMKVNPPLRSRNDIEAVRAALADGTVDVVATDHAPHAAHTKDTEWDTAPCGMLGLETAFAVVHTVMVLTDLITPLELVRRMATAPAEIRRVGAHGGPVREGSVANLAVFDPSAHWSVAAADLHSRSHNSPYLGRVLTGRAVHTLLRGRFTLRDGVVVSPLTDR